MKKLIYFILFFIPLTLFAQSQDYVCDVRNYRIDLNLRADRSTHIWITDTYRYETIAMAYAGSLERRGTLTYFFFYPVNAPIELRVKTSDLENFPKKIQAYIKTRAGGFLLWENISCRWR